ncbi:TPA: hypothetical protein PNO69_004552 [Salmonella enterica]|nr:hypothetical protein [Salmonella enterica]HCH9607995.1 hypothetical protein [Salmonella enterica]HDI5000289.1 hypothetical protein [Salmonella enterica]HDI5005110.1 hypothetical protein [Salmonella enterica]
MTVMLQALLKASKKQDLKVVKKKEKKKVELFDESILVNGGVSQYTFEYEGKKKVVFISCHTPRNNKFPKYKYHIKNAFGNRVFIKAKDYQTAQAVIDAMFSEKGKYLVSASAL